MTYLLGYFSPSDKNIPTVGPTFSARPTTGANTAAPEAMAASDAGQGTSNAIAIAKASNPAEAQAAIGAEAVSNVLPDASQEPPPQMKDKLTDILKTKTKDVAKNLAKEGAKAAGKLVKEAVFA